MSIFIRSRREEKQLRREYKKKGINPGSGQNFSYALQLIAKDFVDAFFKIFEWSTFIGIVIAVTATGQTDRLAAKIFGVISINLIILYGLVVADELLDRLIEAELLPKVRKDWISIILYSVTAVLLFKYIWYVTDIFIHLFVFGL